jgi:putative DNA primase/helicase
VLYFEELNERFCEPEFNAAELRHKVTDAVKAVGEGFGELLLKYPPQSVHNPSSTACASIQLDQEKIPASRLDAATEAESILMADVRDGVPVLRYHRDEFLHWKDGCYHPVPTNEIFNYAVCSLNEGYSGVGRSKAGDVLMQLKAKAMLSSSHISACWITEPSGWPMPGWDLKKTIFCSNALVNLPGFLVNEPSSILPATPRLFSTTATKVKFNPDAPAPELWLNFLQQLWPEDPSSIQLLQEWFGLCLVPDMSQHKCLLMVGPARCGKSTISKVLTSLVGKDNVCSPSLSSLGTQFGLWPFLNKSLAVIADARIGSRADHAAIAESLLKISGEDPVDIHRKNLESLRNVNLSTRIVIISNEIPRFYDQSGALASRMITLRFVKSFLGKEDRTLGYRLLAELEGILLWAIQGWNRLNHRGHFYEPESSKELAQQLEELTTPISRFVNECCCTEAKGKAFKKDLYKAYAKWCEGSGRIPGCDSVFFRDLLSYLPQLIGRQSSSKEGRLRFYEGISLLRPNQ